MRYIESINKAMAKEGINTITGSMHDFISDWMQWYRGNVNKFHTYNIKLANGQNKQMERLTMNMAKKVCEDMAKLLWSEKATIKLGSDADTKRLWEILDSKRNNFSVNLPDFIERTMALGTGMLVEYTEGDETLIDYVDADLIIPFEYNNSYISGVITVSQSTDDSGKKRLYYSLLTIHHFAGGIYTKDHELFVSESADQLGRKVDLAEKYPELEPRVEYETETPHFQILRPNLVNNLDTRSPMGISIFANRIDNLKALDTKYDAFTNEFMMGKKRILVDRTAVKGSVDPETGNIAQYFDTNDTTYMAINGMENQPVKEIDFQLRHEAFIQSINAELNYLAAGVGLGQKYYDFDGVGAKTATEVISENSDTFRTKVNHEIVLGDVLYDLVTVICELEGINHETITVLFDDSVIEDKDANARQALIEYNAGLIDKVEFFVRAHGMEKEEAIKYVADIESRNTEQPEEEPEME